MTVDEETLRRIIREELERFELKPRVPEGLSDKRRRAALTRWGKRSTDASALQNAVAPKRRKKKEKDASALQNEQGASTPGSAAFLRYATGYKLRYNAFPVRNAKVNALLAQLVKRLGDDAGPVAEFYCTTEEPLYVRAAHPIELLVRDAEKLHMIWETGRQGNGGSNQPWWETWSGLEKQGDELGIERDPEHPQDYRQMVLRAARRAGRLPDHAAHKMGMS